MSCRTALLADVCDIAMGQAPSGETYNTNGEGLPLIAGAGDFGDASPRATKFTTSPTKVSQVGDIVLCIRATIGDRNWSDAQYCLGRGVAGLSGHENRLDQRYLWHWLSHAAPSLRAKGRGATFLQVNKADISSMEIPLPSLAEQRRIATILDKADALRAKRRETIAKLDQLLQSVFLDMFGDPVANPKNWPKESLASLFDIARGGSPRPIDAYITDAPDGVNWIMIGDTVEGSKYIDGTRKKIRKEGVSRSRAVRPGDFLLTNSMSFGRPYILRTSGCIHDGWLVLSPRDSRTSQDYLHSALSSPTIYTEFARRAPGATVKNLNIDLVSGVDIPVPPSDLQAAFSEAIQKIEVQGQRLQHQANQLDTLFASLQHRAFTGTL